MKRIRSVVDIKFVLFSIHYEAAQRDPVGHPAHCSSQVSLIRQVTSKTHHNTT